MNFDPKEVYLHLRITIDPHDEFSAIDYVHSELVGELDDTELKIASLSGVRVDFNRNGDRVGTADQSAMLMEVVQAIYDEDIQELRPAVAKKIKADFSPDRLFLIEKVKTSPDAKGTGVGRLLVNNTINRVIEGGGFAMAALVAYALQYEREANSDLVGYLRQSVASKDHQKIHDIWASIGFKSVAKRGKEPGHIMLRNEKLIQPQLDLSRIPFQLGAWAIG